MSQRVYALQRYLDNAGFSPGAIDGDRGAKTNAALEKIQVKRGGTSRIINRIVVHCSATREGQVVSVDEIRRWHKAQGWRDIGYHYVIGLDGKVSTGRPVGQVGSHVANFNSDSIGVVYVGGVATNGQTPKDTRTPEQKVAFVKLLTQLATTYPAATICGHRDLSPDLNKDGKITPNEWMKACPSFDAPSEYRTLEALQLP